MRHRHYVYNRPRKPLTTEALVLLVLLVIGLLVLAGLHLQAYLEAGRLRGGADAHHPARIVAQSGAAAGSGRPACPPQAAARDRMNDAFASRHYRHPLSLKEDHCCDQVNQLLVVPRRAQAQADLQAG
jgi:hypothetical protein